MIQAEEISKSFNGKTAVDSLSFEVGEGDIFGLLGPNGAGKTTTLRMLIGILRPDRGKIRILGQNPSKVRSRIGYLPEERGLYRKLKVIDMLCYLASLKGLDAVKARRNAEYWLERF
ncbi:ABC transporter ATP-binding protein [Archaeoglobus veneficus]|uniref:ABC transporter ATP-binding protein n=1 Tax=Archaeoglobus veneficus TaxID=58290 RepID=UPI0006948324|nr:ATP-binding cassette domain-containing protein [Archaeoglobus veneficus]